MLGFYKQRKNRLFAGILASLAHQFGWDRWIVRFVFIILFLFFPIKPLLTLLYVGLAYVLPYKEDVEAERYGTGPRRMKEAEKINKDKWF